MSPLDTARGPAPAGSTERGAVRDPPGTPARLSDEARTALGYRPR